MFHIGAFLETVDNGGALLPIAAVREEMFFTTGDDYRVPTGMNFLAGAHCCINDASAAAAQLQAPSLRLQANINVEPIIVAADFGASLEHFSIWRDSPVELTPDEALNFAVNQNPAAGVINVGLVLIADGPLQPVSGKVFTVRATAAIAQSATGWVNGNLTFDQVLPAGMYQVIGARFRSADAIAGRLVFPAQVARPGFAAANAIGDMDHPLARFGGLGVWGEFPNTIPPTLDILGGAAAVQVVLLDLLRVS